MYDPMAESELRSTPRLTHELHFRHISSPSVFLHLHFLLLGNLATSLFTSLVAQYDRLSSHTRFLSFTCTLFLPSLLLGLTSRKRNGKVDRNGGR